MKKPFFILSILTILFPVVFLALPNLDIATSKIFYTEGQGFLYRDAIISSILFYSVRIFTVLTIVMCLGGIFYDLIQKHLPAGLKKLGGFFRSKIPFTRKQLTFLFLVIVITPGILVHNVFKPMWERARPVDTLEFGEQFGRTHKFTDVFTTHAGQDGNSFPSGHAAMAFAMIAFVFVVSAGNRKRTFAITLAYAFLVSACRIWQGGHFLSDVTFSALLTLWTILLLNRFYLNR